MVQPPWYKKMEDTLQPMQGVVTFSLVIVAIISVYMIVQRSAALRTAWLVYLISP